MLIENLMEIREHIINRLDEQPIKDKEEILIKELTIQAVDVLFNVVIDIKRIANALEKV